MTNELIIMYEGSMYNKAQVSESEKLSTFGCF
jgi:hypothetical protein